METTKNTNENEKVIGVLQLPANQVYYDGDMELEYYAETCDLYIPAYNGFIGYNEESKVKRTIDDLERYVEDKNDNDPTVKVSSYLNVPKGKTKELLRLIAEFNKREYDRFGDINYYKTVLPILNLLYKANYQVKAIRGCSQGDYALIIYDANKIEMTSSVKDTITDYYLGQVSEFAIGYLKREDVEKVETADDFYEYVEDKVRQTFADSELFPHDKLEKLFRDVLGGNEKIVLFEVEKIIQVAKYKYEVLTK